MRFMACLAAVLGLSSIQITAVHADDRAATRSGWRTSTFPELEKICPGIRAPNPAMHAYTPDRDIAFLEDLLDHDAAGCPGIRAAALGELRSRLGDVRKGNVDIRLLAIVRRAAEEGKGMAPDPVLADQYGRIEWLYSAKPPVLPRWPEAQRKAWLTTAEAVALLEGRVAAIEQGGLPGPWEDENAVLVMRRLAEIRLRRDLPGYDPLRALRWLERIRDAQAVGRLLSDGVHLTPDYPRAARLLLASVTAPPGEAQAERALLLKIGRAAAAAVKTPEQQAEAARILFAATVHDPQAWAREKAGLLRAIGPVAKRPPQPRDADCASNFAQMNRIAPLLAPYDGVRPAAPATIGMRGLIGSDNRLVWMEVTRSSGSPAFDAAMLRAWARAGGYIRMWDTARGSYVSVDFPPIPVARTRWLSDACLSDIFPY